MGLFDFFRRRDPTRDEFAQQFVQELKRAGITRPIEYETETDRILIGSGDEQESINLANFYREYVSLPRAERRQHLVERAKLFAERRDDLPEDFDDARKNLRPKLWVRAGLEQMRLQIILDGGNPSKFDIPEYECGSHLVASLVYDRPQTMQSIPQDQLNDWGVTYYEAMEIARENLEEVPASYAQIGDGCYAFMTGDSYDACRLLLPTLVERLEVKGDLIAMVPNRDALLVTGSADETGLLVMSTLATKGREEPRPMVPVPLRRDGDDWVDWLPPKGHPSEPAFREMALRFEQEIYAEQKQLLDAIHEQDGADVFVDTYTLVKKDDGRFFSYSMWGNGYKTLMSRGEWVIFVRGEGDICAMAPWAKVEEIAGHLLKPTDYYPPRFEVEEFPTDEDLAALGKGEP